MKNDYDKLHEEWDKVHIEFESPTYRLRKKIILKTLNEHIKRKKNVVNVLDVGCGTGDYTIELSKICRHITAFDLSEYAIEKAKKRCIDNNIENVEFKIDDITKFITQDRYDVIIMSEVLEHLDDDRDILKKYVNTLNDEGMILCSVPFDQLLWSQEDEHSKHVRRYDMDRIDWLIRSSNLQLVELFCYGSPLLRMIWSIKKRKKTRISSPEKRYSFLLKTLGKVIVFIDSFNIKGKNGVGVIFLAKKLW